MGATVSIAMITFFSTSYLEWRMGKQNALVHWVLLNPFFGFLFSLVLTLGMGLTMGAGVGIGVGVGSALGLATNDLTYNFFEGCAKWHRRAKAASTSVKAHSSQVKEFYANNERVCSEALQTLKMGVLTIGALLGFLVMLIGVPGRLYMKYKTWRGTAYDVA